MDESSPRPAGAVHLHQAIYQELAREIQQGVYRPGERIPSEAVLCQRFGASRITIAKAMQALQRDGVVLRRPGSGTYVQQPSAATSHRFGLLIPQLGSTEIFEPICQGIMRAPLAKSHVLLWGPAPGEPGDQARIAEQLCRQFIDQQVTGIFFAPLEYVPGYEAANHRIVELIGRAGIPLVLLDRSYKRYPESCELDLVGIDNLRAGYTLTQHLWMQGARRFVFVASEHSACTVAERMAGFHRALQEAGAPFAPQVRFGDTADPAFARTLMESDRPDGIVCANDITAARLMRSLINLGVDIPGQVRMGAFDDVDYAQYLPVPLTTIHQDCSELGRSALSLMLARVDDPARTPWDVRVPFELIVRQSCGGGRAARPGRESVEERS